MTQKEQERQAIVKALNEIRFEWNGPYVHVSNLDHVADMILADLSELHKSSEPSEPIGQTDEDESLMVLNKFEKPNICFKYGDFVKAEDGYIGIFLRKMVEYNRLIVICGRTGKPVETRNYDWHLLLASEQEKKHFIEELHKGGFDWDGKEIIEMQSPYPNPSKNTGLLSEDLEQELLSMFDSNFDGYLFDDSDDGEPCLSRNKFVDIIPKIVKFLPSCCGQQNGVNME